jgi:hypothetical protein
MIEPTWFFDVNFRFNFSVSSPSKSDIIPMKNVDLDIYQQIESMIWSDYVYFHQHEITHSEVNSCLESKINRLC